MSSVILVVDDSRLIRLQIREALEAASFRVIEAGDGEEALARLANQPTTDLIVSDIHMPRMDGIELLRHLRRRKRTPYLPVLMLSAESDLEKIDEIRTLGARGWMLKPFRPAQLIGTVRHLLARRKERAGEA